MNKTPLDIDPIEVIEHFYTPGTRLYDILVNHSRQVTEKALEIAHRVSDMQPDTGFIERAAMLHDIGIFRTRAPSIECHGEMPYICHGYIGRQLLDEMGLPAAYGYVAERHTGAGITLENILTAGLPLPHREMVPVSLEEKIICCADKYFSKGPKNRDKKMDRETIYQKLRQLNEAQAERFATWADMFRITP